MYSLIAEHWILFLCLMAVVYVLGVPLIILKVFHQESHPTVQVVDPDVLPVPEPVQRHLELVQTKLTPVGFRRESILFLPQSAPNVRTILALLVNRSTQESAMAVTIYGMVNNTAHLQTQYVEFSTHYRNGQHIDTGNTREIGAFKSQPTQLTTHLPWITDPVELYYVHQAISSAKGDASQKDLRLDTKYGGDALTFVAGVIREALEAAVEDGYLRLSDDGTQYKATLKGAYLMTWKNLPPFKSFIVANRRRRANNLLRELDVR